jgi:hypothetical protein
LFELRHETTTNLSFSGFNVDKSAGRKAMKWKLVWQIRRTTDEIFHCGWRVWILRTTVDNYFSGTDNPRHADIFVRVEDIYILYARAA